MPKPKVNSINNAYTHREYLSSNQTNRRFIGTKSDLQTGCSCLSSSYSTHDENILLINMQIN